MAQIYDIDALDEKFYNEVGGKARGLAKLVKNGHKIPKGFIVIDVCQNCVQAIIKYYKEKGYDKVAVRSSATGEDGVDFSGAGQYETVLDVVGENELEKAIKTCLNSLHNERADEYNKNFGEGNSAKMNLVIQAMVDARVSGVCFTKNPITREDNVLIEAVEGLGEALVSGTAKSSSYEVNNYDIITGEDVVLSKEEIRLIASEARQIRQEFGEELDLEWSISKNGKLYFLQARPITTLEDATIDELDGRFENTSTDIFTTCNIGEMLPGAVTPLATSTFVNAIDQALRRMLVKSGVYSSLKKIPPGSCSTTYNGHCFINMTSVCRIGSAVLGADAAAVQLSICGRRIENGPELPWKKSNGLVRAINGLRYGSYLFARKKAMKKIVKVVTQNTIPQVDDIQQMYKNITDGYWILNDATFLHMETSSYSGAMSSALVFVLEPHCESPIEVRSIVASMLENIDDIDSVHILMSLKALARKINDEYPNATKMSSSDLLALVLNDKGEIRTDYDAFMKRHGHRAIREAEVRSQSWKECPLNLIDNIKTVISSGLKDDVRSEFNFEKRIEEICATKPKVNKGALKFLGKAAREGCYDREYTKTRFVKSVEIIKEAYHHLAKLLKDARILPDKDLIFFLTHEELGRLINNKEMKLVKKAFQRRNILEIQKELRYEDVCFGKPQPLVYEEVNLENGTILNGIPISRGEVKGLARIIKSVEDAKLLKDGEIMVCAFTDIGWSPYFTIAKGMITEVGSALSHGAVVAREYALPLVVNVSNATRIIKTGDEILLNASKGTVTIINQA